ncbi:hypothetical protein EKO04_001990 [Ascochyta lentis]|uniref:Uncharacterized protein n=1 Tax=Ascochyta lentis TaxID=205686 RepID=A0A8H7JD09_9PLEO|nr:hypothetical protein EKO04_001990 [Ascochyta lentis]
MFHRRSESPINQPVPAVILQSSIPPFPHLRGGAASPDDIPPTLFWLAGGKGKPVSFSGWKQSRPKQRMGGLFGMAVFGKNYGTKYDNNINQEDEVNVSHSVSTKVTVNEAPSVNSAKSCASTSSSSSSSSASVADERMKEMLAGTDGVEPIGEAKPVQCALTPSPNAPADDVPLCSGALPVEAAASPPRQDAGRTLASDGEGGNTDNASLTKKG